MFITNIDVCVEIPCQNNGTCVDLINDYYCSCIPGFNGTNCTNNMDECASVPCQNNGTCIDLINDYECLCDVEFNGTDCSTKSNLMKYTLVLYLDVTTTENLSIEEDYIKVENKVQQALSDIYSKRIKGSEVIIKSVRKGSLIVNFDLILPDSPTSKLLVVDTMYKLVNGLFFVNFSGEIVNVTTATIQHSTFGEVIITNSTDGCAVVNSQGACDAG
ncbi:protein HEG-like [Saccostrea echinata]|uniref:protein HEG-like n=1 Tax=Saccostrea echinata TaxID=191078 RepID=UPI002A800A19|nr:protein HEG-like [Saccostrea echinata]